MLAAVRSAAVAGIEGYEVTVEVDVALGLPQWTIVGLPSGAVRESRERVGAALANSGFSLPARRITVNLSPADTRKEGTAFDLPIAIGLLVALGILPESTVSGLVILGELGLDGSVRTVRGLLPVARRLSAQGCRALVVPRGNVAETTLVRALRIAAPATLRQFVEWLLGGAMPSPEPPALVVSPGIEGDFAEVVGQDSAKRALEIAAAGAHACLLIGPPGAGKTMLARRLPSILPRLTDEETLEVAAIHSVAGLLTVPGAARIGRPFRAPHHSVSAAGLVGGGGIPRPGEASLAHQGVLFLDELLEFPRAVLEALRQPMEDGRVVIARAATTCSFPARFSLIAATNPCPCGNAGEDARVCACAEAEVLRYRGRLSGPLADRIDMHVTLGVVPVRLLDAPGRSEGSTTIRARVEAARARQRVRYREIDGVSCNAYAPGPWMLRHGHLDAGARELLAAAADSMRLSARGYHRVLKVARTIADLEGSDRVIQSHVAEALRYRSRVAEAGQPSRNA